MTTGQLQQIFLKYLKEHPERLHYTGLFLAVVAFKEAFPCKN